MRAELLSNHASWCAVTMTTIQVDSIAHLEVFRLDVFDVAVEIP